MWKYVLNKMIKQKEAIFFIVMIILSFAVSSAAPYLNGKFIDLLTVSKDIHLIVQFALIIVGVGVVGALLSYCSNLTTVKVLTKTTMASIYEGMDNLLETDLVIAEKLDFSYIAQRLFQDANVITSFVLSNFLSIFLNVCFCGGETLLRKELMCECIKILKPSGSHCTAVTNGLLANPATIQQLASAGLDGIQFSLDGLRDSHERLRNKVGIFPKVIDAMKYVLNETELRLSIAFTPTSFNVKDFLGVYDLLVDLYKKSNRTTGSDYIDFRLQPLMLLGRAKDNPNIVPTEAQYRWLVQNINEVNLTGKCHPCIDVKWGDPIDHLVRFRDTNYFMDQVSVHANGDIVVSAYLPLVVGNVRKRSLSDYWNAGLKTIWATNVVQYLTARMQSVSDMENITTLISDINMDGCLNLDLMENDLNDLNLIKGVILEEWM